MIWTLSSVRIWIKCLSAADSKTCSPGGKKNKIAYVGIAIGASCFTLLVLSTIWWKCCLKPNKRKNKGMSPSH